MATSAPQQKININDKRHWLAWHGKKCPVCESKLDENTVIIKYMPKPIPNTISNYSRIGFDTQKCFDDYCSLYGNTFIPEVD